MNILKNERLIIPGLVGMGVAANFLKEMLVAYYYGASTAVDLFKIVSSIPNSFFQSLGAVYVGLFLPYVLTSSSSRVIVQTKKIMVSSVFILLIGVLSSFLYPYVLAPGMDDAHSWDMIIEAIVCWIGFSFVMFTFQRRVWLQAQNKKEVISATSLINSLAFMLGVQLFVVVMGANEWSLIASFVISNFVILIAYVVACGKKFSFIAQMRSLIFSRRRDEIAYSVIVVAILFHATRPISRIIDRAYASYGEEGAISHLEYAYNFYVALGMIFGTSLILILSKKIAKAKKADEINLDGIVKGASSFVIVATLIAGMISVFSDQIVSLVYLHGKFDAYDMKATSDILRYLMIGVPVLLINMVLLQVAYAYGVKRVLIVTSLVKVSAKYISIDYLSNFGVQNIFGLSNFVSELCCFIALAFMLHKMSSKDNVIKMA